MGLRLAGSLAVLAMALTACGGSGDAKTDHTATATTGSATSATPAAACYDVVTAELRADVASASADVADVQYRYGLKSAEFQTLTAVLGPALRAGARRGPAAAVAAVAADVRVGCAQAAAPPDVVYPDPSAGPCQRSVEDALVALWLNNDGTAYQDLLSATGTASDEASAFTKAVNDPEVFQTYQRNGALAALGASRPTVLLECGAVASTSPSTSTSTAMPPSFDRQQVRACVAAATPFLTQIASAPSQAKVDQIIYAMGDSGLGTYELQALYDAGGPFTVDALGEQCAAFAEQGQ